MHCHIEFHVVSGFVGTLIEAPESLNITIPQDHLEVCRKYPDPISGNAAGNKDDPYNLTGSNVNVPQSNYG